MNENNLSLSIHEGFMKLAIKEARKAYQKGEVPIGCVITNQGKVVAKGHNQRESSQNATRHAEMIAIEKACKKLQSWRLEECVIYITLEPCIMCAGAIMNARIKTVVFGASEPNGGAVCSRYTILQDNILNHNANHIPGVKKQECENLLKDFFKERRKAKKATF